jgi:hypothetical protein
MNEKQLEAIVLRQRSIIAFAQAAWTQAQEEKAQLRQIIAALRAKLEEHGLPSETRTPESADQLSLPLFSEVLWNLPDENNGATKRKKPRQKDRGSIDQKSKTLF